MCTDYGSCCGTDAGAAGLTDGATPGMGLAACSDGMICFGDDNCDIGVGEDWESYRDSLSTLLSEERILSITGIFNDDESYDGSFENLGVCRAEAIKSLFAKAKQQYIVTEGLEAVGENASISDRYRMTMQSASDMAAGGGSPTSSQSAVIYFPYNSTNKLNDGEIESYLRKVAQRIKDDGGKVYLTGHTDDKGSAAKNMELGQRRANVVMDYLLGQGLLRSQMRSESKGESSPVANNATAVGRAKNRRVELRIIR